MSLKFNIVSQGNSTIHRAPVKVEVFEVFKVFCKAATIAVVAVFFLCYIENWKADDPTLTLSVTP